MSIGVELYEFLCEAVFPPSVSARLLSARDQWPPHPAATFDGYYLRLLCDDGSSAIVIFCTVRGKHVLKRPNYLHFSYHPKSATGRISPLATHQFPQKFEVYTGATNDRGVVSCSFKLDEVCNVQCSDNKQRVQIRMEDNTLIAIDLSERTLLDPLRPLVTPHGTLARLTTLLPLHWGILTPHAKAQLSISRGGDRLLDLGAVGHFEKNWGSAFPSGWVWSQGMKTANTDSFALAGGHLLGNKAYMVTVCTQDRRWIFRPPWAISILGILPIGFRESYSCKDGSFRLTAFNLWQKVEIVVQAKEPFENWHAFYAPMKDGIDHVSAFETFTAYATVQLFERQTIFGVWKAVETIDFENSCLEFGGSYAGKHPAKRL